MTSDLITALNPSFRLLSICSRRQIRDVVASRPVCKAFVADARARTMTIILASATTAFAGVRYSTGQRCVSRLRVNMDLSAQARRMRGRLFCAKLSPKECPATDKQPAMARLPNSSVHITSRIVTLQRRAGVVKTIGFNDRFVSESATRQVESVSMSLDAIAVPQVSRNADVFCGRTEYLGC